MPRYAMSFMKGPMTRERSGGHWGRGLLAPDAAGYPLHRALVKCELSEEISLASLELALACSSRTKAISPA